MGTINSREYKMAWVRAISRWLRGDDRGGALVELAFTLPVLFTLLLGAAEFGRLAYAGIEVSNAARAGAAYGAQNRNTANNTSGIQAAAVSDSADITMSSTPSVSRVCACSNATTTTITCSTALTNCASPHRIIERITVTTSGTINSTIRVPGLPTSYTLQGTATMEVAQ